MTLTQEQMERYTEFWNSKPWWYKVYSRVYHRTVLWQYKYTGWLPRWIREG